jgi:beta-lactamase class A
MAAYKGKNSRKFQKSQYILAFLLLVVLILLGFLYVLISNRLNNPESVETTAINPAATVEEGVEDVANTELDSIELQKIVDNWVNSNEGTASVVIADTDNYILATSNPDKSYFAASIYKLYVAYAGYQQLDNGEINPDEIYINNYTRQGCLDIMIRDSDSPCAEKLWNEIGKEDLTRQLVSLGINDTSMVAITTTAEDAALMLSLIARGEGLSEKSKNDFLASMEEQDDLYRRGLPSGFSELTVYNKVGWNLQKEWHDTAIVELKDGRKLIVTIMSENIGFRQISEFGKSLEEYLLTL